MSCSIDNMLKPTSDYEIIDSQTSFVTGGNTRKFEFTFTRAQLIEICKKYREIVIFKKQYNTLSGQTPQTQYVWASVSTSGLRVAAENATGNTGDFTIGEFNYFGNYNTGFTFRGDTSDNFKFTISYGGLSSNWTCEGTGTLYGVY